jgi:hypothetical protein
MEIKLPTPVIYPGNGNRNGLAENCSLVFQVVSDDRLKDDHNAVLDFDSIPKRGAPYSFGGTTRYKLRARTFSAKYKSAYGQRGAVWEVEVGYDNSHKADDPPDPDEADPFTITPRMEKIELPMEVDLDGNLVRNSAGQKFDTPPMLELFYPVFTVGRTEYGNPCRRMTDFTNRVNGTPFWGQPPGKVLMKSIMPGTSVTWGAPAWQVQYEIAINIYFDFLDLWQLEILDMGMQERSDENGFEHGFYNTTPLKAILDKQGKEVTQPVPLDGKGKKLPEKGEPIWFWHRKRYEADLNI